MRTLNSRVTLGTALIVVALCLAPQSLTSQSSEPATEANLGAYGCAPPSHAGVSLCQPGKGEVNSPFLLAAGGTGADGPVRLMELWADGRKVTQVYGNELDQPVTLPNGSHQLTVVELDTTGHYLKSNPFNVTVVGNTADLTCTPPAAPGVNVCESPGTCPPNQTWSTVIAAGTGASGKVSRMELWVAYGPDIQNGPFTKLANFPGNTINVSLNLVPYEASVQIIEVDSNGAYIKSPVYVVQIC